MLLEQRAALSFGHATPDAELNPVVQGIGTTLRDHRAVPTDHRGLALSRATDKQLIRISGATQALGYPRDPGFTVCQRR